MARETKHSPSTRCVPLSAAHFHLLFSSPTASARFICSRAGAEGRKAFGTGLSSALGHPKPLCFTQNLCCPVINHTEAQGDVAGKFWLLVMSNQQSSPGTSSPPIPLPWGQQHPCPSHQAQAQHSPGFHSSDFIQQNATLRARQGGKKGKRTEERCPHPALTS